MLRVATRDELDLVSGYVELIHDELQAWQAGVYPHSVVRFRLKTGFTDLFHCNLPLPDGYITLPIPPATGCETLLDLARRIDMLGQQLRTFYGTPSL